MKHMFQLKQETHNIMAEQSVNSKARIYSNYSDFDGPTSKPKPDKLSSGDSDISAPFVATVFSDYSNPRDAILSDETGENVARMYNSYTNMASVDVMPPGSSADERWVAKAVVRKHITSVNALDGLELDNNSAAVFIPHSDWDIAEVQRLPVKPVSRTQSHMERGQQFVPRRGLGEHQPSIIGPGHASQQQGQLGYRQPYGRGVFLNKSSGEATTTKPQSVDKKNKKDKDKKDKGSGEKKKWWSRKPVQGRSQSAENAQVAAATLPPPQPKKSLPNVPPTSKPVQRSASDASAVKPVSMQTPDCETVPELHHSEQTLSADFEDDAVTPKILEDPHAIYARPSKIKRKPEDRPRQISTEDITVPPPIPPHPPAEPEPNQVTVKAIIENMEHKENEEEPSKPRLRQMSTSSNSSIGYAKAGVYSFNIC